MWIKSLKTSTFKYVYYNRIKCDRKHTIKIGKQSIFSIKETKQFGKKPSFYSMLSLKNKKPTVQHSIVPFSSFYQQIPVERSWRSTYKTVHVQRAFTSRCTLYVTAVPGARPKTAAITLWSAHRLSHWDTQERRVEQRSPMRTCVCVVSLCLCVCISVYFCLWRETFWEEKGGGGGGERENRERKSGRKRETEQLDTHRSDIGPYLAPSSNLRKICGMGLKERKDRERQKDRQHL